MQHRRLLLVSFHFGRNGATGGFRWAALLPYLRAEGWSADVITSSQSEADSEPWGEHGISVHVVPSVDWPERVGGGLLPLLRSVRPRRRHSPGTAHRSATTDAERMQIVEALSVWRPGLPVGAWSTVGRCYQRAMRVTSDLHWSIRAAQLGRRIVRERVPDIVVVSTPPHWTQVAGVRIARAANRPLILDFRDPWVVGLPEMRGYIPSLVASIEQPIEAALQRQATAVVHNTELARDRALEFTPPLPGVRRAVVRNGYDDPPAEASMDRSVFRIVFSGWLYPFMDPRPLFRASAELAHRHGLGPDEMRLQLIGSPDDFLGMPLPDLLEAYGLAGHADLVPRTTREEALVFQARAAALVAFDHPNPLCVVMKAYDYLQMPGELVLLGDKDGSLGMLAKAVGTTAVEPTDMRGIAAVLERAYQAWKVGRPAGPHDPERRFHRSRTASDMVTLLEEVVSGAGSRAVP